MMVRTMKSQNSPKPARRMQRWLRGQTMVEFAAVALPMCIVVFGIIVVGMAIYSYSFVCYGAREGVRYAIVHGSASLSPASASDIQNYVQNKARSLNTSYLNVSTNWKPDNKPGSVVRVQVNYGFQPFFPMSTVTVPLSSSAQMVISR
jgi:Flp pilus assembly protein TadG